MNGRWGALLGAALLTALFGVIDFRNHGWSFTNALTGWVFLAGPAVVIGACGLLGAYVWNKVRRR